MTAGQIVRREHLALELRRHSLCLVPTSFRIAIDLGGQVDFHPFGSGLSMASERAPRVAPPTKTTFGSALIDIAKISPALTVTAPNGVYALDAATGTQIRKYEATGTARRGPCTGPASTASARESSPPDGGMAAIDPKDGKIITSFGDKGSSRAFGCHRLPSTTRTSSSRKAATRPSKPGTPSPARCDGSST